MFFVRRLMVSKRAPLINSPGLAESIDAKEDNNKQSRYLSRVFFASAWNCADMDIQFSIILLLTNQRKNPIIAVACGRGGIGIRARLRGVFLTEYGFKSHRPHQSETLEI